MSCHGDQSGVKVLAHGKEVNGLGEVVLVSKNLFQGKFVAFKWGSVVECR